MGSVLGLTQFRIKRLLAYSTISHVGFILLALSINTAESIQSYIFYILQYSLSNLNAFMILVTIGFSFYLYVHKEKEYKEELLDQNNSPIQLISQIKGYFYINPFIAISLSITLFSFIGIPPVMGFFAKQMILSAAMDNGYMFMAYIAILTSVVGAAYYLNLIKQVFFYKKDYNTNPSLYPSSMEKPRDTSTLTGYVLPYSDYSTRKLDHSEPITRKVTFGSESIGVNSSLSSSISIMTLLLLLFIYTPAD